MLNWVELDEANQELELNNCKILLGRDSIGYNVKIIKYCETELYISTDIDMNEWEVIITDILEKIDKNYSLVSIKELNKLIELDLPEFEIDKINYISRGYEDE